MAGSYFRGRPITWDPDRQALEGERQRWVMEHLSTINELITAGTIDPAEGYRVHRDEYVRTGDPDQLRLALAYVVA